MAINKVGSKGIEDGSVATVDLAPGSVTNAKLTNSSFTFDGTSISLGGSDSVNLSASWQSVITADGSTGTTAVAGNGYFIDTTSAAHTLTLPSSATIGDFIAIKDYAGTFNTNNLTIARNGHNIQGAANDSLISTNRASLVLVYVDSTKGWLYTNESNVADLGAPQFISATGGTITTSGDYKIHTFTGDGCFVVSQVGNTGVPTTYRDKVDYLILAGGGGGAYFGGGGGAGGLRASATTFSNAGPSSPRTGCVSALSISTTTYPVTVGAGGPGSGSPPNGPGSNGSNSIFSTITSAGGGGGGIYCAPAGDPGQNGGSGGGGGNGEFGGPAGTGGSGNTPPVNPPQGSNGGATTGPQSSPYPGTGAGGGFMASGADGGTGGGGNGGTGGGFPNAFGTSGENCGSYYYFAGGGGGHGTIPGPGTNYGTGGLGGGGVGTGGNGSTNTGGGGGSSGPPGGGNGGSGIVIIRYKFQ